MLTQESEKTTPETRTARISATHRVAGILLERIRSGQYVNGEMLPTERALAEDLHVHRRVIRSVIDQLVQDEMVYRKPHCRPIVGRVPEEAVANGRKGAGRISASNLIALIMWHGGGPLEHAGTSQQRIFWGMNQSLMEAGYHTVFLDLGGRPEWNQDNAGREAAHLRYIMEQGFGGAVFYPYAYRENRELVQEVSRSVPLVLIDRKIARTDVDFVGLQNHDAMLGATNLLIQKGHKRIAYLTCWEPIDSVQDRTQGYIDAIRSANDPEILETILTIPSYNEGAAWRVVDAVFRLPEDQRPTAIACFNDYAAVNFAEHLEKLGLRVPEDVAVTGFDDIVPTLPGGVGLTTLSQPYEEIGSKAVELLLRRIKNRSVVTTNVELPAKLIVRESTP